MKKILNSKFQTPNRFKIQKMGFTLIELLVVISIIVLLAALIMVNFNAARERARDVQRKSDLDQIKKALRMYYNDYSVYPDSLTFGTSFGGGEMIYMKTVPNDPSYKGEPGGPQYRYQKNSNGQDFCLWATLENKSDGDITKSQSRCSLCSVGTFDYVVCAD